MNKSGYVLAPVTRAPEKKLFSREAVSRDTGRMPEESLFSTALKQASGAANDRLPAANDRTGTHAVTADHGGSVFLSRTLRKA